MRILTAIASVAALLGVSAALPDASLEERNYCVNDSCFKAVKQGPKNCAKALASAKNDCSSFLRPTVTPCPIISTTTKTKTVTKPPKTATVCDEAKNVITETRLATVVLTNTVTAEPTLIATLTATQTITQTVIEFNPKFIKSGIEERHACPAAGKPSNYPSYASTCRGAAAYSSACACLGVKAPKATILRPATKIKTFTKTETAVPTATVTRCATTRRTTVEVTLTRGEDVTVTSPVTRVQTVDVTETVRVDPPEPS